MLLDGPPRDLVLDIGTVPCFVRITHGAHSQGAFVAGRAAPPLLASGEGRGRVTGRGAGHRRPRARLVNLTPTPDQEAFRAEVRAWLREQPAVGVRQGPAAALRRPRRGGRVRARRGRRSSPAAAGSASPGPRSTAAAAPGRSSTTSSRGARPRPARRSSSAASASTSSARRCSRTGTDRAEGSAGCRGILDAAEICVPAVQRARRRQRPRRAVDARRAAVDGGWVLNGQKVWTRYAQFADWGVCLARTEPRRAEAQGHLVPRRRHARARRRGAAARQITDETEFNEVFFADVFVPDDQLVGPVDEGWRVANSTLTHERGINPRQLVIHIQLVEELLAPGASNAARSTTSGCGRGSRRRPSRCGCSSSHNWRTLSRVARGAEPGPEGSIAQAVLERDEQAPARHRDGRARPGAPLWRGATTTPATARGSGRGSTTRRRRSGRARTRSSATSSASASSACPREPTVAVDARCRQAASVRYEVDGAGRDDHARPARRRQRAEHRS